MLFASMVLAALPTAPAGAHDMTTADHAAEDAVVHTAAQEQSLDAHTKAVSAPDAARAAAAVTGGPQDIGQWGPVVDWPVIAINAALLPNGKVLAYDSIGDNATETFANQSFTRATVWDPTTGGQTNVEFNLGLTAGYNIFCSGFAHLTDGSLFIAGGNKDQALNGIDKTT